MKDLAQEEQREHLDRLESDLEELKKADRQHALKAHAAKILTAIIAAIDEEDADLARKLLDELRDNFADHVSYRSVAEVEARLLALGGTAPEPAIPVLPRPPRGNPPAPSLIEAAKQVVRGYVLASRSTSIRSQLDYYAPSVDYFDQGTLTRRQIAPILKKYRDNYTTEVQNLAPPLVRQLPDGTLSGSITYDYISSKDGTSTRRRLTNGFNLRLFGNQVLVTAVMILKNEPLAAPLAGNSPEGRIQSMLTQYYLAGNTGRGLAQVRFFTPSSNYFGASNSTHADIRKRLQKYHQAFPFREFEITRLSSLTKKGNSYVAKVQFRFRSSATATDFQQKEPASGSNEVVIVISGDSPRISSIK